MKIALKITLGIAFLLLLVACGCEDIADLAGNASSGSSGSVRGAEIGDEWRVDQMEVDVPAGGEALVLLRLEYGDDVDGYFYVEKGNDVSFRVSGNSGIYEAEGEGDDSALASDRFSFRASEAQGKTYTLTFENPSKTEGSKSTVFLEVIYPVDGSIFMPIEKK